jgi:hypothetical protein
MDPSDKANSYPQTTIAGYMNHKDQSLGAGLASNFLRLTSDILYQNQFQELML